MKTLILSTGLIAVFTVSGYADTTTIKDTSAPPLAAEQATEKAELAEKLIKLTKMEHIIDSLPQDLQAQLEQRRLFSKNIELETKVTDILIDSVDAPQLKQLLRKSIIENATTTNLKSMLAWYESPLGSRLLNAELNLLEPWAQTDIAEFAARLQKNPPNDQRVRLIQEFEEAAQLTDFVSKSLDLIIRSMLSGLQKTMPAETSYSNEEMENDFAKMKQLMREPIRQQTLMLSYYIYQDFPDEEINEYIKYLKSAANKENNDISIKGLSAVYNSLLESAAEKLGQPRLEYKK